MHNNINCKHDSSSNNNANQYSCSNNKNDDDYRDNNSYYGLKILVKIIAIIANTVTDDGSKNSNNKITTPTITAITNPNIMNHRS